MEKERRDGLSNEKKAQVRKLINEKQLYLKYKFNMTIEEYDKKLSLQLGGCAICKQPSKINRRLHVDHDHKTGAIRDLLCQRCNRILGLLYEDENLIWDILDYLKRHNEKVA
jgi:hypothetical protein